MTFLNLIMLTGLAAVSIPILIHLLNRSRARVVDWGAMRFLMASLASRSRRILIEEIVLMILRCLILALAVFAVARPFLPSRPTLLVLLFVPAVVAAAICAALAAAMWADRRLRLVFLIATLVLLVLPAAAGAIEQFYQSSRWSFGAGEKDVVIVIDGSMSMTLSSEGQTNFARAVDEARMVVASCEPADGISIVLAGPAPQAVIGAPTNDRKRLAAALDGLQPVGGAMRAVPAMQMASHLLSQGGNPGKKLVVLTDGQHVGWDVRTEARWRVLGTSLKSLPTAPHVVVRTLPMPEKFVNAGVTDLRLARRIVGTDREVAVDVAVRSTGTEPAESQVVKLFVDGEEAGSQQIARIGPNATETVHFNHRFRRPGRHVVSARLGGGDDLSGDDAADRVVDVLQSLPVLIVDGAPSARPLDGAADFIDIALAPPPEGERARGRKGRDDPAACLIASKIVAAPDIASVRDLDRYALVILADVPLLPKGFADSLAGFVAAGGGLLIAPGEEVKPSFYNAWQGLSGRPVMPAKLVKVRSVADKPARLALETFSHPALAKTADEDESDARSALVSAYWQIELPQTDRDVAVGGQLDSGEAVLVERRFGKGSVLLTTTGFHPRLNNLPALECFVPLMHELTYHLAAAGQTGGNVESGTDMTIELSPGGARQAGGGLKGEYFNDVNFKSLKLTRVDPRIDFAWGAAPPAKGVNADGFAVRWTGRVRPRFSEKYTFHTESDDGVRLWIGGRKIIEDWTSHSAATKQGRIDLKADRPVDIRLEYFDSSSEAVAKLYWSSRSQSRQIVPADRLYSDAASGPSGLAAGDELEVVLPSEDRRLARVTSARRGEPVRVGFHETYQPGLYRLVLPQAAAGLFASMSPDGKGVPFVVLDRRDESTLSLLTDADLATARGHLLATIPEADPEKTLVRVEATNELTAAVAGGIPGRELWQLIAVVLVAALLAEIGLTRWIAVQRKALTASPVSFGSEAVDVQAFRTRAKELLAVEEAEGAGATKT